MRALDRMARRDGRARAAAQDRPNGRRMRRRSPRGKTRTLWTEALTTLGPRASGLSVPAVTRERCFSLAAGSCDSNPGRFRGYRRRTTHESQEIRGPAKASRESTAIDYRDGVAAVVPAITGSLMKPAIHDAVLPPEQAMDEVLVDSFPASDPRSWNPGTHRTAHSARRSRRPGSHIAAAFASYNGGTVKPQPRRNDKPTPTDPHLAELLDFRPDKGIIRLHEQRVVILSAAAMGLLQERVDRYPWTRNGQTRGDSVWVRRRIP